MVRGQDSALASALSSQIGPAQWRSIRPSCAVATSCGVDYRAIEVLSQGLNSSYVAQSLKELEAQAATDKATIERLRTLPSLATVLPHPAMLVQRALDLQELFKRDPVAGREGGPATTIIRARAT